MQRSPSSNLNGSRNIDSSPQRQQFQSNLRQNPLFFSPNQTQVVPPATPNYYPPTNQSPQPQLGLPHRANLHQSFKANPQQRVVYQGQSYSMSPVRPMFNSFNQAPTQVSSQIQRNQSQTRFIRPGYQVPTDQLPQQVPQKTIASLKGRIIKFELKDQGKPQNPPTLINPARQNTFGSQNVLQSQLQNALMQNYSYHQMNSNADSPVKNVLPLESETRIVKDEGKSSALQEQVKANNVTIQKEQDISIPNIQQKQTVQNSSSAVEQVRLSRDLIFNSQTAGARKEPSKNSQSQDSPKDQSSKILINQRVQKVTSQAFQIEDQIRNQTLEKTVERPVEIQSRIEIRRLSKKVSEPAEHSGTNFITTSQNAVRNEQASRASTKNERLSKVTRTMTKQQVRKKMQQLSEQLGISIDNRMAQSQTKIRKKLDLENIISYRDLTRLVQNGLVR